MTADSTGNRGDLLEYATAVATAEDTTTVFEELSRAAERAFDFSSTVVEAKDNGMLSVRTWSGDPPVTSGIENDEGIAGHTYQTGETVHVENTREDPRVDEVPDGAPLSVVSVPMDDAGVFQAGRDEPGGFDDADVEVVEQLAEHARGAIERIRSKQRLEASEHRFRSLFEDADHPLVLYRTGGGRPAASSTRTRPPRSCSTRARASCRRTAWTRCWPPSRPNWSPRTARTRSRRRLATRRRCACSTSP